MDEKDNRYPSDWDDRSRFTRSIVYNFCVNCWIGNADETHHLYYPPHPLQLPLTCLVPLCDRCHHKKAHSFKNYIVHPRNKWRNRNTSKFAWMLRFKMFVLLVLLWLPPVWLGGAIADYLLGLVIEG